MKLTYLLLLLPSLSLAGGPLYHYQDPATEQEFQNVYQNLRFPNISTGTAANLTITNATLTNASIPNAIGTLSATNFTATVSTITTLTAPNLTATTLNLSGNETISGSTPKLILNNTATNDSPYIQGGASNDGYLHLSGGASRGVKLDYNNGTRGVTVSNGAGVLIQGTNTNDNANAGDYGEIIRCAVTTAANFGATGVYTDLCSISLTAGDWDVTAGIAGFGNGTTTFTQWRVGIGTVVGNSQTGFIEGDNWMLNQAVLTADNTMSIAGYRVSISGTTTYYFKYWGSYTGTAPQALGRMNARRMR